MVLFGHYINTYFIILPVMLLVSCILGRIRGRRSGISPFRSLLIPVLTLFFSVLGAKLLFILENIEEPVTLAGVSLYGAVFLLPAAFLPVARWMKIRYAQCMDLLSPLVALTLAAVRVGCFISGCCGGRELTLGSCTFTLPVQLIETVLDLIIFTWMLLRERKRMNIPGDQYPFFMITYGAVRFVLEFIRTSRPIFLHLTGAQWLSLFSVLTGIYLMHYYRELSRMRGSRKKPSGKERLTSWKKP